MDSFFPEPDEDEDDDEITMKSLQAGEFHMFKEFRGEKVCEVLQLPGRVEIFLLGFDALSS